MGNCLPFLNLQRHNEHDDLTRLEQIQDGNSRGSRRSSRSSNDFGGSRRTHRPRNHPVH